TLIVEITDTSSRSHQRDLEGTQVPFANGMRAAQVLDDRRQVPHCGLCQRWGHPRVRCTAPSSVCEHCGGDHDIRHHCAIAVCCRGSGNVVCPHPPKCVNCGQPHRANARECPYYVHRNDFGW
ncbi:uncharacterized protein BXZ73DRAFT_25683, partial [Epithele typhae]|uniref:uncharacterized protein n=1 Tax=Epithele typhae TaxID=378194 RepID=UPI002007B281